MNWKWIAAGALLLAPAWTGTGRAESGPRRPSFFSEIRRRLIPPDAADAWREARQLPSAVEALPLMEDLAKRGAAESPAAALWLGHFYYGAGNAGAARPWFEQAAAEAQDDGLRAEARSWGRRCSIAEPAEEGASTSEVGPGSGDLRERLVRLDALTRTGNETAVWESGLDLEESARAQGLLGPVVFRLVRAASRGAGDADRALDRLTEWSAATGPSPDRALARALSAGLRRAPAPAPSPGSGGGDSPFVVEQVDSVQVEGDGAAPESVASAPAAPEATPGAGPAAADGRFEIQLGSFADRERAEREAKRLHGLGLSVTLRAVEMEEETRFQLRWGSFRSREEAEESAQTRCTGLQWAIVRAAATAR